jgi:DNA-binding Lrp family transcriptional regulator
MKLRKCETLLRNSVALGSIPQNKGKIMPGTRLDEIDRMILAELQADGRMTNVELAKRVGISAPPCLRRVRTLEEQGFIKGYHAEVDARELGFEVQVFAMVGLQSQAEVDLSAFEQRCQGWPLVRECHMLNGEVDFILKCVAPDLRSFQRFLTEELTSAENVASVKTSLVIRGAKDDPGVPFDVLEERLALDA